MGTETKDHPIATDDLSEEEVKLNNPLMGTETALLTNFKWLFSLNLLN